VGDDSERLFCLDSVLKLNPGNQAAQRGASSLRQKGVFPAIPVYPEPKRPAPASPSYRTNFAGQAQVVKEPVPVVPPKAKTESKFDLDWNKPDQSGLFEYAVMELSNHKSKKAIEKELVGRGASQKDARAIVADADYALKKGRREKYKKRLVRGLIWTVVGVAITCGTYAFASELGGKFFLFYGAIIFGFIDFIIGLIGWLVNN
jgi:hypothetical protein